jgi:coiled-coil-helix-coiled-coil-helix domain-containing protein 2
MAATAGSVAVGSTIGHGISSMLFGGRSESAPVEQQQQQQATAQQNTSSFAPNCEIQAKEFSKCIEKADLNSCSWYLEQLKAVSFPTFVIHALVLSGMFDIVSGSRFPILIDVGLGSNCLHRNWVVLVCGGSYMSYESPTYIVPRSISL